MLSVDTRKPFVVGYPVEDSGNTAHYVPCWVAVTGEKAPSNGRTSVTIGA